MYDDEYSDERNEPERSLDVPVNVTVSWSNEDIVRRAARDVTAAILKDNKDKIETVVFGGLDDLVNRLLRELVDRTVVPTDKWGDPVGKSTTIRELLQRSAEDWLMTKVDSYGHEATGYSAKYTRLAHLFKDTIGAHLSETVKAVISKEVGNIDNLITEEVKKQLRAKIK
jgi:hypothetical protein